MEVNSSCSNSPLQWRRDILALSNLPPGYDKEQISSLASLEAWWPAKQASRNVRRFTPFVRKCISSSMATVVYAHGTTILTNRGPSELVEEHIFMPTRLGHGL